MSTQESNHLEEFNSKMKNLDLKRLEIAEHVLNEMLEIKKMREIAEKKEEALYSEDSIAFIYFALKLDPNAILHALQHCRGKIRILKEKNEKKAALKEEMEKQVSEQEEK